MIAFFNQSVWLINVWFVHKLLTLRADRRALNCQTWIGYLTVALKALRFEVTPIKLCLFICTKVCRWIAMTNAMSIPNVVHAVDAMFREKGRSVPHRMSPLPVDRDGVISNSHPEKSEHKSLDLELHLCMPFSLSEHLAAMAESWLI